MFGKMFTKQGKAQAAHFDGALVPGLKGEDTAYADQGELSCKFNPTEFVSVADGIL